MPETRQQFPIVVGVDFSECSKVALRAAIALAKDLDARIVLVHAFSRVPGRVIAMEMYRQVINDIEREMNMDEAVQLSAKWAAIARNEGVAVDVVAEDEDPARLVLRKAQEHEAAFIVVGTHGHGAVKKFFLGSVAQMIIRKSMRPVMVVPEPPSASSHGAA